jgi:hypothetical protein
LTVSTFDRREPEGGKAKRTDQADAAKAAAASTKQAKVAKATAATIEQAVATEIEQALAATDDERIGDDLLFGAQAIADEIGRPIRGVYHLLENGSLPAQKLGATWVASRSRLRAFFGGGRV